MRDGRGDVLGFEEIDRTQVAVAGGKGAHLGELSRLDGVRVPPGFCVTTAAYARVVADAPGLDALLDRLSALTRLTPTDSEALGAASTEIRRAIEAFPIPEDLAASITAAVARLGEDVAFAVRSSATAEDSPAASFAGQQDTYLDVTGSVAILEHVRRCWASLFTERAVVYRMRNGFDHRKVRMAVVVQRMVFPRAAGIAFTADPVTGNRKVTSVEATFGLGEALVSGLVNADVFEVRGGAVTAKRLASTRARPEPTLTDAEVVRLAALGRRIEAHFGRPQDIEWCFVDDDFQIVQSRPITTLFPIPKAKGGENHVYISVGHQQMMTDAMKPLGVSFFQLTAARPMVDAGGRLFVDVTRELGSSKGRAALLAVFGRGDPLIRDAVQTLLDRGDFVRLFPDAPADAATAPVAPPAAPAPVATDPAIVAELIAQNEASVAALKREIATKSGPALLDFILADLEELKRLLFEPRSRQATMAGMEATWWLDDHLEGWLGEKNAADALAQSAPGNVTSEMGLALLDVADVIRPHPNLVAFLEHAGDEHLDELASLPGGREARAAIDAYLEKYGMRCVGEIDISRPRWNERPATLVPAILGNIASFEPGAAKRRFERGWLEAAKKEEELLSRLRALPDGEAKAEETRRTIDRLRTFIGYREYPKYGLVCRYSVYRGALLGEAERLVRAGVIREQEDIFYLTFEELQEVTRTHHADDRLVRERREEFRWHRGLRPPRVLTSDGEGIAGSYRRDDEQRSGALVGLAVSAGVVEGRARVILDLATARLEAGDILVTAYTDPSWTPLFVAIGGLVTEVGGRMTHGAVIAREYGLPAVVGVEDATRRIEDGQRIRVNGTDGSVEILPS